MSLVLAVAGATVAWFVAAGVLFFNPVVDRPYRAQESDPAVRSLPQTPKTIAMILAAVLAQSALWAGIYWLVKPALGADPWVQAALFGVLIVLVKVVPRDIDRLLLTTYPKRRMAIEFFAGIACAFVVSSVFAHTI